MRSMGDACVGAMRPDDVIAVVDAPSLPHQVAGVGSSNSVPMYRRKCPRMPGTH